MKSGKVHFTKIRKWAAEVGAVITESNVFDEITIEYKGKKFVAEMKHHSTSARVISRGRGTKWAGSAAGFYFGETVGFKSYAFESTQKAAIEKMEYETKKI
jgi:hypothetical protein